MRHETLSFDEAIARAGGQPRSWRWLLSAGLAFLAAHVIAERIFPGPDASLSFLVAAPTIAALACLARARGGNWTGGWIAFATALALWAAGMGATMIGSLFSTVEGGVGGVSMLLFVLYGVPIIFVTGSPDVESPTIRMIDAGLALVLGYLFFVHTFAFATTTGADEAGVEGLRAMFDVENAALAAFAAIRFVSSAEPRRRALFLVLAIFTTCYLVSAAYINHFQSDTNYGDPTDLLIDLPFLVAAGLALGVVRAPAKPIVSQRTTMLIRAGSPLMLALMLVAVSILSFRRESGLAIAGLIVASIGLGIRNMFAQARVASQAERLDALARRDALTGLANRREFDAVLVRDCARAARSGGRVAVLMIDVDHFKRLNDTFGHSAGDERLRMIGVVLAACIPEGTGLVARYGGEEFAAILPGASIADAKGIAESIRVSIAALKLEAPNGHVTVSIGAVSVVVQNIPLPGDLVQSADAALYAAKRAGRDRVVALRA